MTIPMAIVDFIPVVLFLIAAILLQRDLYNKMSKGAFALFSAGTIVVFAAGLFKAIWKLLVAARICNFVALNKCFMPMQSLGFLLAAAGVVAMLCFKQGKGRVYAVAAPVAAAELAEYSGTMLFIPMMVLGVLGVTGGMAVVAVKRKKSMAAAMYIVSFVLMLGMGYMSSKDAADTLINWIEQGINVAGQGLFLLATWQLHRDGLGQAETI